VLVTLDQHLALGLLVQRTRLVVGHARDQHPAVPARAEAHQVEVSGTDRPHHIDIGGCPQRLLDRLQCRRLDRALRRAKRRHPTDRRSRGDEVLLPALGDAPAGRLAGLARAGAGRGTGILRNACILSAVRRARLCATGNFGHISSFRIACMAVLVEQRQRTVRFDHQLV
jgi:hypothetical protein